MRLGASSLQMKSIITGRQTTLDKQYNQYAPLLPVCTHKSNYIAPRATALASSSDVRSQSTVQDINWSWLLPRQCVAAASSGAVLGPFLDGMHSSNNVLHYHDPVFLRIGDWQLETCWWVPVLFGLAGIIIGVTVPLLDVLFYNSDQQATASQSQQGEGASNQEGLQQQQWHALQPPSWPQVLFIISLFVAQYGLSGKLAGSLHDVTVLGDLTAIDTFLIAYSAVYFMLCDRTVPGFALSFATLIGGPLIEVGLINGLHLYHYEQPDVAGIPIWILWVYFSGGPAVGNLGRRIMYELLKQQPQRVS